MGNKSGFPSSAPPHPRRNRPLPFRRKMGSGTSRFLGGARGSAAWNSEFVAQIGGGELKFFPFRAHDFRVNARGWRLGGLPCTIVAAHGRNSAPTFPFTFKTHGIWFERPDKICARGGENFTPISQTLAHIRIRLNYPMPRPCAADASPAPSSHSPQLSSALVPWRHLWRNHGRRCTGPPNR